MAGQRIAVAKVGDLQDGQMKEIQWPGGDEKLKILLSRVGGVHYATGANCSHYGAPLAKGVLSSGGRITCPWHGACFSAKTGDIEDAPGIDSLQCFKVDEDGGQVFVTAEKSAVEAKFRKPTRAPASAAGSGKGVVIVGAGAGAAHTIDGLRESGYKGSVTLIGRESFVPPDRTKVSKALLSDPSKLALRTPEVLQTEFGVTLKLGSPASAVDFKAQTVALASGEQVGYDKLVVATGASPRRLPVEGADLGNVWTLREPQDAEKISSVLPKDDKGPKPNIVIIGSSFIGMELCVALGDKANKTVVGMEKAPFERVLGLEVGKGLQKVHEGKGTKFVMESGVKALKPSPSDPSRVGSVELSSGQVLEADGGVVLAVGVAVNTQLLKGASGAEAIEFSKDGSVLTDGHLAIKGVANAFAVGDIATYPDRKGQPTRIEHWNVAGNHGRCVAKTIASGKPEEFKKIPIFWSAQGGQLRYCSTAGAAQFEETIVRGDVSELNFEAYYLKGDEVVAVASMSRDPLVVHCAELFQEDRMLSAADIRAGKNPLDTKLV